MQSETITIEEAKRIQNELRERLVLMPPKGFSPECVAGADISTNRGSDRAYAGIVVLDAETKDTLEQASAVEELHFPYVPGYLSFRELPPLLAAWRRLERVPDVVIFDGQGTIHPRRFGLACHGGVLFGVPSVGCAKSLLVGRHDPVGEERGSTTEVVHRGEVVGMVVRTRTRVRPLYVSPGHLMDLPTSVDLVLRMTAGYREPETTRRSHRLVNQLRKDDAR